MITEKFIIAPAPTMKVGHLRVSVGFIYEALPKQAAEDWCGVIQRFANRYARSTQVYALLTVIRLWLKDSDPALCPRPTVQPENAAAMVKNLRRIHFETGVAKGKGIRTLNHEWSCFITFLAQASRSDLFPRLRYDSPSFSALPANKTRVTRNSARTLNEAAFVPRNMNRETDSYHEDLLVPLSLHLSNDEYLATYERELQIAVESFRSCALADFVLLKDLYREGEKLIESTDYKSIKCLLEAPRIKNGALKNGRESGYKDPNTNKHIFDPDEAHPNLLGNLLSLVVNEMGGIPKPYQDHNQEDPALKIVGPPHWAYVTKYGRHALLPYLGLLTPESTICMVVLLLLEHPSINVESLLNADLLDEHDQTILLSTAGDQDDVRMTVDKARAGEQKHVVLTDLSYEIITWFLARTKTIRSLLREEERVAEARKLWVGVSRCDFKVRAFAVSSMRAAFRRPGGHSCGKNRTRARQEPFLERHLQLNQWCERATLRSLRVSKGVLDWFKSQGDLTRAAQAFGHRNIRTTLQNYIPQPVIDAMYERQIRRHQNLIIAAATAGKPYNLVATDFSSYEELHHFIGTLLPPSQSEAEGGEETLLTRVQRILDPTISKQRSSGASTAQPQARVLLNNDPSALAIAILYREHLLTAPSTILDQPDVVTRTSPRMWLDLMSTVQADLPDALFELRELVASAKQVANELRGRIQFPELGAAR